MSHRHNNNNSPNLRKDKFLLSNHHFPASSSPRCDSPVEYDRYWDYKANKSNKRRRVSVDVNDLQDLEPPRKIQVTGDIWKQETARYGIVPAAERRAIRGVESALRATAFLTFLQIEAVCQAILYRISGKVESGRLPPDDACKHPQFNRTEDPSTSESSQSTSRFSSQSSISSPPWRQSLPEPVENIQEFPKCTLHQPATATSCELCGTLFLRQLVPPPPLLTPRSHATEIMQHDTYPDHIKGVVLIEYNRAHSPTSENDMYLCTGAAGPADTLDENGNPFEITDEEREQLIEEKHAMIEATAQRSSHFSQLQYQAAKHGLPVSEPRPYFDEFIVLDYE